MQYNSADNFIFTDSRKFHHFSQKINQQNQQEKPSKTKNLIPGKSRGECIVALLKS